jgi:hypothetical protein
MDNMTKAFFQASIVCLVGNGEDTLFWFDTWLDDHCLQDKASDLLTTVGTQCRNKRTVAEALLGNV